MDNIINFFTTRIKLSDLLSVQVWVLFTILLALTLVVVVLIFGTKDIKSSQESSQKEQEKPALTADQASKQYFEIVNKDIELPKEVLPTFNKKEIVPKQEEKRPPQKIEVKKEVTKTVDDIAFIKEDKLGKQIAGKFAIVNSNVGGFRYMLVANNGQLLYESRDYKAKNTCIAAIEKFIAAVKEGNFIVKKDKFDRYKFVLRQKNNPNSLYVGESFKDKTGCLSNIESVRRFVFAKSPIIDRTSDDFIAESIEYKMPQNVIDAVKNKEGAKGRWEITTLEYDNEMFYEYLLYANNGQLLYESQEYKSYASCKNGLFTFIENVKNGYFVIDSDKAGRYKFILRSNKPSSQAQYIGQFYKTLDGCKESINSVYKFALITPADKI
ncbi:MAG: YegP family protein [Clostridiales bacterium]|nr:YegP family protein [Clostridiales bacterium]